MAKLHALLAVETDAKIEANKVIAEAKKTFGTKQGHFVETTKTYEPLNEDGLQLPEEHDPMVTTVSAKLDYVQEFIVKAIDMMYQKEHTNTLAKASIRLEDGTVIAQDVPATVLLNLENKLKELRDLYNNIPTLPPGTVWEKDTTSAEVYKATPKKTFKQEKQVVPLVKYEATDKHPAQVDTISKEVVIGEYTTFIKSGAWSPARKSEALGRISDLMVAVKKARQEANSETVREVNIGKDLFAYING